MLVLSCILLIKHRIMVKAPAPPEVVCSNGIAKLFTASDLVAN